MRDAFVRTYTRLLCERRSLVGRMRQCVGQPLAQQGGERRVAQDMVGLWQLLAKLQSNLQQEHLQGAQMQHVLTVFADNLRSDQV